MKLNLSKKSWYLLIAAFLLIVFMVGVSIAVSQNKKYLHELAQYEILINYDPFQALNLEAGSAYVLDTKDNLALYSKESKDSLPLASITKFMTVLTAAEALSSDFPIEITPEQLWTEGESGLYPFERWRFEDLASFTLMVSSNDGAHAISSAANNFFETTEGLSFVEKMNKKAGSLSMKDTKFYNSTGLDRSQTLAGSYSTAQDVSKMLDYIVRVHPNLVQATQSSEMSFQSLSGFTHFAQNTNPVVSEIPGIRASKTGFTDLAGGNLVIAAEVDNGRVIIITVLGSTKNGRFSDALTLYRASQKYYKYRADLASLEEDIQEILSEI